MPDHHTARHQLDFIFLVDAISSVTFGLVSLISPHHLIEALNGGAYNHGAHEALRKVQDLCFRVVCLDSAIFRLCGNVLGVPGRYSDAPGAIFHFTQ